MNLIIYLSNIINIINYFLKMFGNNFPDFNTFQIMMNNLNNNNMNNNYYNEFMKFCLLHNIMSNTSNNGMNNFMNLMKLYNQFLLFLKMNSSFNSQFNSQGYTTPKQKEIFVQREDEQINMNLIPIVFKSNTGIDYNFKVDPNETIESTINLFLRLRGVFIDFTKVQNFQMLFSYNARNLFLVKEKTFNEVGVSPYSKVTVIDTKNILGGGRYKEFNYIHF